MFDANERLTDEEKHYDEQLDCLVGEIEVNCPCCDTQGEHVIIPAGV